MKGQSALLSTTTNVSGMVWELYKTRDFSLIVNFFKSICHWRVSYCYIGKGPLPTQHQEKWNECSLTWNQPQKKVMGNCTNERKCSRSQYDQMAYFQCLGQVKVQYFPSQKLFSCKSFSSSNSELKFWFISQTHLPGQASVVLSNDTPTICRMAVHNTETI